MKFKCNDVSHTFGHLQIKTPAQLEAAFSFFAALGSEDFKLDEFEEACGVGMTDLQTIMLLL